MSNGINGKDYSDYFSQLEKKLANETKPKENEKINKNIKSHRYKVIRIRKGFLLTLVGFIVSIALIVTLAVSISGKDKKEEATDKNVNDIVADEREEKVKIEYPAETDKTLNIGGEIESQHVVVVDVKENSVVAIKNPYEKAYPASTTKIMTLLVAVENITDLSDTFTMTYEITDPMYYAGATVAGFSAGEVINLKDMLYGVILPSGGDASLGIATKISGGEKAFVELMNEKAKELGLKNTHFTNCTGLFDANHYTTAADMAVILAEAIKNPLCKEILSTYQYTATPTDKHPEGLKFASTLFSYMYGTEPEGADIKGGKTGFVNESGYCIAAFGQSDNGKEYIAVTLEAPTRWPAFYDQIALFTEYAK